MRDSGLSPLFSSPDRRRRETFSLRKAPGSSSQLARAALSLMVNGTPLFLSSRRYERAQGFSERVFGWRAPPRVKLSGCSWLLTNRLAARFLVIFFVSFPMKTGSSSFPENFSRPYMSVVSLGIPFEEDALFLRRDIRDRRASFLLCARSHSKSPSRSPIPP